MFWTTLGTICRTRPDFCLRSSRIRVDLADQAAKEVAAGGAHMKTTQTPVPWQVAKNKIEEYTISKWKQKWITTLHYKQTKLFYESPNKNKSKYLL